MSATLAETAHERIHMIASECRRITGALEKARHVRQILRHTDTFSAAAREAMDAAEEAAFQLQQALEAVDIAMDADFNAAESADLAAAVDQAEAGRDGIKPLVWYSLDCSGKPQECGA